MIHERKLLVCDQNALCILIWHRLKKIKKLEPKRKVVYFEMPQKLYEYMLKKFWRWQVWGNLMQLPFEISNHHGSCIHKFKRLWWAIRSMTFGYVGKTRQRKSKLKISIQLCKIVRGCRQYENYIKTYMRWAVSEWIWLNRRVGSSH